MPRKKKQTSKDDSIPSGRKNRNAQQRQEVQMKNLPSMGRNDFVAFVILSLGFWYIAIFVFLKVNIEFYLSPETVREMGSTSTTLAAIPFAILSVLDYLRVDRNQYLKTALAGLAILFLVNALMCFFLLWVSGEEVPDYNIYEIKIIVGIVAAVIFQFGWVRYVVLNHPFPWAASDSAIELDEEKPVLHVLFFVFSFLIVQISAVQATQGNLTLFVLFGFAAGLLALIVLILILVFVLIVNRVDLTGLTEEQIRRHQRRRIGRMAILLILFLAVPSLVLSWNTSIVPPSPLKTPPPTFPPTFTPTATATSTVTATVTEIFETSTPGVTQVP